MKTRNRQLTVLVLMFLTLLTYGNKMNNDFFILDTKKVKVVFQNVRKGNNLTIKDKDEKVLYSEEVSKAGLLSKVLDLSNLDDGTYLLELEKDFEIVVKSFDVKNNKVIYKKNVEKVIFKPVIRNQGNKVLISRMDFDDNVLQISLYYNNDIIYSETAKGGEIINRVYKLDKEKKGRYRVSVNHGNRNSTKEFKY